MLLHRAAHSANLEPARFLSALDVGGAAKHTSQPASEVSFRASASGRRAERFCCAGNEGLGGGLGFSSAGWESVVMAPGGAPPCFPSGDFSSVLYTHLSTQLGITGRVPTANVRGQTLNPMGTERPSVRPSFSSAWDPAPIGTSSSRSVLFCKIRRGSPQTRGGEVSGDRSSLIDGRFVPLATRLHRLPGPHAGVCCRGS